MTGLPSMPVPAGLIAVVEPAADAPAGHRSEMDVSGRMVILTWVAFALAAVILHRIAWKPMLRALDRRETTIRKALEDADRARKAVESAAEKQKAILAAADARAREIVDDARQSSAAMSAAIEHEARTQARRLIEDATQEIDNSRRQAIEAIRADAARLAADLAERILRDRARGPEEAAYTERAARSLESDGGA